MVRLKVSLFAVSAVILALGPASAADVVPEPMSFDWSGVYVGVNAGASFGDYSVTERSDWNEQGDEWDIGDTDFVGGAQIGYNYQMDSVVIGAEADIGYLGLGDEATQPGSAPYGYDTFAKIDGGGYATIRGRLGFAFGRFLPYVTGGIAFADLQNEVIDNCNTGDCGIELLNIDSSGWQAGWTVGGGLEFAVAENLSLKAEYLYMDFGNDTVSGYSDFDNYASFRFDQKVSVVRAGVNYNFH